MRARSTQQLAYCSHWGFGDRLYDLAKQRPAVDWRFAQDRNLVDRIRRLELTFTRTTGRTFEQADGSLGTVVADVPAFPFFSGVSRGLDIWESRTNLFLTSTAPATQSITLTAAEHTLSFKGTGTVTLTGASTAGPLVGTGANNRVSLMFTPSAGSVAFTISGTISEPQVELGATASPYIATAGSAATRTADLCSTLDLSWYNAASGTIYAEWSVASMPLRGFPRVFQFTEASGGGSSRMSVSTNTFNDNRFGLQTGSTSLFESFVGPGLTANALMRSAMALSSDSHAFSGNGTVSTLNSGAMPTGIARLFVGNQLFSGFLGGTISRLVYWPTRLSNSIVQHLTAG